MATLTVKLEESLLKRTQEIAEARQATVDEVVADALKEVSRALPQQSVHEESYEDRRHRFERALEKFSGFGTGGPYTRDEMNER